MASAVHRLTARELLSITLLLPLRVTTDTGTPASTHDNTDTTDTAAAATTTATTTEATAAADNNNNNDNHHHNPTPPISATPTPVEVQVLLQLREGDDLGQIIRTQLVRRFGELLDYGAAVEAARILSGGYYPPAVAGTTHTLKTCF